MNRIAAVTSFPRNDESVVMILLSFFIQYLHHLEDILGKLLKK